MQLTDRPPSRSNVDLMGTPVEALLPPPYARWQHTLAASFFAEAAGTPVILFVDDDELRLLAPEVTDPVVDLVRAVREVVDPARGHRMFDRASALAGIWVRGSRDRPPPVLPILALSSLSAARMHSDAYVRSNNYYVRLAQVLLPGADGKAVRQVQFVLRAGAFRPVADMWQMLDQWLIEQQGAAGISTIRNDPALTRIGFPLSQAMIRRSDRAVLTRFFAALEIADLGAPSPEALVEYLQLWAARPRGLSSSFLRILADADLRPLLQAVVCGLASAWDGRVITSEGLAHCEAAVVFDLEGWATSWVIKSDGITEPDIVCGEIGGASVEIRLQPDPYSAFARISGALSAGNSDVIRQGFRLRGSHCMVEFPAAELLVCREYPDAAGWVSGSSVEPFTDLVIAVAGQLAGKVRLILETAADRGWHQAQQPPEQPLLLGFAIFYGVRFSDPTRLDDALATAPRLLRGTIRPDTTTRARLVNGLPLASNMGRHHYLVGGEPDLLLPVGDEPRTVPASLDGAPQQPPFTATGFPISLRRIGPLPAGQHIIEANSDVLRFMLLERDPAGGFVPAGQEIGWDETGRLHAGATLSVRGAASPRIEATEPVLVRRGANCAWTVSRTGQCSTLSDPPDLTGPLAATDGIGGYYYELLPGPDHAWLAEERRGRILVRPLRRLAPDFVELDQACRGVWSIIAPHGPGDDPLWRLYLKAWECCRGR